MPDPTPDQSEDRQRLNAVESDVVGLKIEVKTAAQLLVGVGDRLKEFTASVETLKINAWPPASYILSMLGWCVAIITGYLAGMMFLINAQVANGVAPLDKRIKFMEDQFEVQLEWKRPITKGDPMCPRRTF